MKQKRIPVTDSIRELAAFWDTHDTTDFSSELEETRDAVFKRRERDLTASATISFGLVSVPVRLFADDRRNAVLVAEASFGLEIDYFVPETTLPAPNLSSSVRVGSDVGVQKAYDLLVEAMKVSGYRAVIRPSSGTRHCLLLRLLDDCMILEHLEVAPGSSGRNRRRPDFKDGEIDLAVNLIRQLSHRRFDPRHPRLPNPRRDTRNRRSVRSKVVNFDEWVTQRTARAGR